MNIALVLAGGIGSRMKRPIPKQFVEINDLPLIIRTLKKFVASKCIDYIVVVCLEEYINYLMDLCEKYNLLEKRIDVINGGDTRAHSIRKGLEYINKKRKCSDDVIVIHNANMPMVTEANISECIDKLKEGFDIVTSAAQCTGYFYEILAEGSIGLGPDREKILAAKVPEALLLNTALKLYLDKELDCKKYESYTTGMLGLIKGMNVGVAYCATTNFKITTEDDYELMHAILKRTEQDEGII